MFSVSSLLNEDSVSTPVSSTSPTSPAPRNNGSRPACLDISNLLCSPSEDYTPTPTLSPTLTPSPVSVMSTTAYPFPPQQHHVWPNLKQEEDHTMCWYSSDNHYHHRTQEHHQLSFAQPPPSSVTSTEEDEEDHHSSSSASEKEEDVTSSPLLPPMPLKAKRRRANAKQLEVLNRVFERTFFPSTQLRAELGRQLGMSPRTVQIWFQNRRQAIRTRERQRLLQIRDSTIA